MIIDSVWKVCVISKLQHSLGPLFGENVWKLHTWGAGPVTGSFQLYKEYSVADKPKYICVKFEVTKLDYDEDLKCAILNSSFLTRGGVARGCVARNVLVAKYISLKKNE